MVTLDILKNRVVVKFGLDPYFHERLRVIKEEIHGGRFAELSGVGKCWRFPIYKLDKILKAFPDAWHEKGVAEYREFCRQSELRRSVKDAPQPIGVDLPLWEHQRRAVHFAGGLAKGICNAGVGVGKTHVGVAWGLARMEANGHRGVLVVTKSVGKYKYRSEILRAVKGARVAVVEGEKGPFPAADQADWTLVNWELLHYRLDQIKEREFSAVVFSEAHKAKAGRSSLRGAAAIEIAESVPSVLLETASLALNRNSEAFAPCYMLGLVDNDDYYNFHIHFCDGHKVVISRWRNKKVWDFSGSSHTDELHAMLRPYTFYISKEEALPDLPPVSFTPMLVDLSNLDDYDAANNDFLEWVLEQKGYDAFVKAKRAQMLVKTGTLYRLSAIGMASSAIDLLETYVEAQEKVVVFCSYKQPLFDIQKAYPESSVMITGEEDAKQKDRAIELFQSDPKVLFALCSTEAAGESATLTAAANVVFLGVPWSPEQFSQAFGRCHRAGQRRHVEVVVMLGRKTIDVTKVETIYDKALDISKLVTGSDRSTDSEALRGILETIHGGEPKVQEGLFAGVVECR